VVQILPAHSPAAYVFWACVVFAWLLVVKVRKEGIGWLIATIVEMVYYEVQEFRAWRAYEREDKLRKRARRGY
jgi:hypothetical protein